MQCPHCGKQVTDENAVFCPYCSKPLNAKRHPTIPLASGTLTTISAIIVMITGLLSVSSALNTYGGYGYGFIAGTNIFFWLAGIFEVAAFPVGLAGAIFQFRRRQFLVSAFSNVLLIVSAAFILAQSFFTATLSNYESVTYTGLLLFGIPLLALSILSIVFVGISKAEFKK